MSDKTPAKAFGRPKASAPDRVITETRFFPLASAYGAFVLPLFVLGWTGRWDMLPGLTTSTGHAHELFFGYALAVVTGFLVNRIEPDRLWVLIGLWVAARLTYLTLPGSVLAMTFNAAFAVGVAATAAPRFMKAAKKWRNKLTGPLVIAICLAAVIFQLLALAGRGADLYAVLGEAVVLFAMLMLFFGGRMIAPAAAGVIEGSGGALTARVQPRVESVILLAMIAAVGSAPFELLAALHGLALICAGLFALVRLLRWKMWRCLQRADLVGLGTGYAWLGAGLILLGLSRGFDLGLPPGQAVHAITIGALGTLTASVMLRTRLLRLRVPLEQLRVAFWSITALMSVAALARMLFGHQQGALMLAALAWMAALLILLIVLTVHRRKYQRPSHPGCSK